MFRLSSLAIDSIKVDPLLQAKLRIALNGKSDLTIYRCYTQNKPNNDLTLYAALEVLSEETRLPINQIVERVAGSGSKLKTKNDTLQS